MRRLLTILAITLHLVLLDEVVKELAVCFLKGRPPVVVLPNVFNLAYVENRGCAWGLLQGQTWPLAVFGVVALAFLVWKRRALFGDGWLVPSFLYAGIVGNLIDRVFRGCVVDLFDFHWGVSHFPCFNVADSLICLAAGLVALESFRRPAASPKAK